MPLAVLLIAAGDHVPGTAGVFDELFGNGCTGEPEQMVKVPPGKALNVVVGAGVTVTLSVAVVAHNVALGVNVYVAVPAVLLIVEGLHVPANPSLEVAGNVGGVVPAQKGAIAVNVGVTFCTTLTLTVTGVAETHCPALGVNVLIFVPVVAVLIEAGLHVPVTPFDDVVGKTGATAFWHNVAGYAANVGVSLGFTVTDNVLVFTAHWPDAGVKVKVCVPGAAVLIVAGLQVPGIGGELVDVAGSTGAGEPSQIGAIGLNVGVTGAVPVIEMICAFWQRNGVN